MKFAKKPVQGTLFAKKAEEKKKSDNLVVYGVKIFKDGNPDKKSVTVIRKSLLDDVKNAGNVLEREGWSLRHYSYNTHFGIWSLVKVEKGAELIRVEIRVPEPTQKEGRKNVREIVERLMGMCEKIRKAEKIAEEEEHGV